MWKYGLLFITPTLLAVVLGSTMISFIPHLPFKEVKGLKYKVLPVTDKIVLNLKMKSEINISLYSVLLLIIVTYRYNKKNENLKIKVKE